MRSTLLSELLAAFICMLALWSLSACGNAFQTGTGSSNTPSGVPSVMPTQHASTTATQMKNTPPAHLTVIPGQVAVIQDKSHYGVKEGITVTIMNGLAQDVYISAYHTNCTLAILEKQTDTTWVPQGNCLKTQGAPNPFMQLKSSSVTQQRLTPFSGGGGHLSDTWQPGTYRITISYTTSFDPDSLQGGTLVRSQTFTIG